MDTDLELPGGWFSEEDIEEYKRLYSNLFDATVTAEIGVFYGRSICSVAEIIKEKNIIVHCFDAFSKTERLDIVERTRRNHYFNRFIAMKKIFIENITSFGIQDNCIIHEGISWEMLSYLPNDFFDFIFIDGDHSYDGALQDITVSKLKIKPNGVIAGHDYNHPPEEGLRRAVHESFGKSNIKTAASFWSYNETS